MNIRIIGCRILFLLLLGLFCRADAPAQAPWEGDARVEQAVRVEAEGLPVRDLLARLGEKTGVALSARGEVAEEKAIVFARRRPLRALLDDLAALFDATWEKLPGEAPARYELYLGQRARNRERALYRETLLRLSAQMDACVQALALSPEELARRPEDDPVRDYLSAPGSRTGIALYALLTPAQKETLWTARRLSAPYVGLSPAQQRAVAEVMGNQIQGLENAQRLNPNVKLPIPRMEDLATGRVQFRVRRMGGHIVLMLQLPGAGLPLGAANAQTGFVLPPHGDPYDARHPLSAGSLPDAEALRVAQGAGASMADRLRALARATDRPLLADFYRSRPLAAPEAAASTDGDGPGALLDALCREPGYLWWKRGDALLFRKRDWYAQKPAEAPDPFYLSLAESLPAGEMPTAAHLLRLRALTPAQVAGIAGRYSPLADESLLDGLPELLALLASMPSGHAAQLATPEGVTLAARDFTAGTRTLLARFLAARDMSPDTAAGPLTLQAAFTEQAAGPAAPACAQANLRWTCGATGGTYYLSLPRGLPDDRRDRTKVERMD